jgi:Zn-dependent protease
VDPIYLLMLPVFLFCITVHELAHAYTAKLGGDRTSDYLGRISLNPLVHIDPSGTVIMPLLMVMAGLPPFGWAKPVPVNTLKLRESVWMVYVALAGPASNFALVIVIALVMKLAALLGAEPDFSGFRIGITPENLLWTIGYLFIQINIVLGVFNLLPIPPLDGSRVVYHFFIRHNSTLWPAWMALEGFLGIFVVYIAIMLPPVRWLLGTVMSMLEQGVMNFILW